MIRSQGVIGSLDKNIPTVNIFGGGICGLLVAYSLKKKGYNVYLYEKENRLGGKISTIENEFGISESAANAIFSNPDVLDLLKELDIDYIEPSSKLKKFILRDGKIKTNPFYIKEILQIIFGLFKKIPTSEDISINDFFKPLFGQKICDSVVQNVFNGIYASSIKDLHFKSIFKAEIENETYISYFRKIKKNKMKGKSISFKNGMQQLIYKLQDKLQGNIILNSSSQIDMKQNNFICTNAIEASALLRNTHPRISELLGTIQYTNLSTHTVFTLSKIDYLDGAFGILRPYSETDSIGILNNKAIFKNRTKDNKINSYTFITKARSIEKEIENLNIKKIESFHWPQALPVYNKNRFHVIQEIRALSYETNNLAIFGNYVDGISLREMISHIKNFTLKS